MLAISLSYSMLKEMALKLVDNMYLLFVPTACLDIANGIRSVICQLDLSGVHAD